MSVRSSVRQCRFRLTANFSCDARSGRMEVEEADERRSKVLARLELDAVAAS